jgi:hypothetical protein
VYSYQRINEFPPTTRSRFPKTRDTKADQQAKLPLPNPYSEKELSKMTKPQWLVVDHIESGTVGSIYGDSGTYKTFLALDLALSVAAGVKYLNKWAVQHGPVLYLSGEGNSGIYTRIRAWLKNRDQEFPGEFYVYPAEFDLPKLTDELLAMIRRSYLIKPVLLVIDTLSTYFGDGDENNTKDMRHFTQAVRKLKAVTGAAILTLHHTGKDRTKGHRGSVVLKNDGDFLFNTKWDGGHQVTVTTEKQKDSEKLTPYQVAADVIDLPDGSDSLSLRYVGEKPVRADGSLEPDLAVTLRLVKEDGGYVTSEAVLEAWPLSVQKPDERTIKRHLKGGYDKGVLERKESATGRHSFKHK